MVTNMSANRLSVFDNFNFKIAPYAVGFDRVFDQLTAYAAGDSPSTGFPPYNIRKEGENKYVIEMALAGFGKDDIEVEVADSTLSVRSAKVPLNEDVSKDDTVYRGISRRKFDRKFTLAEDVIVNGAELANGMLILELERVVPEAKKPRRIDIK